jgi:N-acetylmuramoyl-L-alanine amidase
VVVRGGCGAAVAAALVLSGIAHIGIPGTAVGAPARELRAVALRPAADGVSLVIDVSRATMPRVRDVRDERGTLVRIHVDLPAGTTIKRGAAPPGLAEGPIDRVRIGLLESDRPRVVVDVDGAMDYRVEPTADPTRIVLTVLGSAPPAAPDTVTPPAVIAPPSVAAPTASAPPARQARKRGARPKIVLDPGHGGDDPGAQGFVVEKEMTLDVARRLKRLLRTKLGAEVVLTRDADATLSLKERTARANAEGADLFVSIHANATPTGDARGIETYYLDNSTDHGTLRLAKMENGLDLLHPERGAKADQASLRYILSDLVQVGKLDDSVRLARNVQRGLVSHLRGKYPGIVDLGVKRGPFFVLVGAYMPCVLVETAFLTHPVEGPRLVRESYRADLAEGLYRGIARFLRDLSRRRTL